MKLSDFFLIKQDIELFLQKDYNGIFLSNLHSTDFFRKHVVDDLKISKGFDSFLCYWSYIHKNHLIEELLELNDIYTKIINQISNYQIKNKDLPKLVSSLVETNQLIKGEIDQFEIRYLRLQKKTLIKTEDSNQKSFVNFKNWISLVQESVNEFTSTNKAVESFFNFRLNELYQNIDSVNNEFKFLKIEIENFYDKLSTFYDLIKIRLKEGIENNIKLPDTLGYHILPKIQEDRVNIIDNDTFEQISNKIKTYTDWKYPTLEIGPGDGKWTDNLVGSDPLYLLDIHKEYIDKTIERFNEIYSKRIRTYLVGQLHNKSTFDYSALPTNQIGFIFSWGVFDYHPIDDIDIFLQECGKILRPGGTTIFSYNDCDYLNGLKLFETKTKTFVTKSLLKEVCDKNNLEILSFYTNKDQNYFWVEIRKSGTRTSIKKSQPSSVVQKKSGRERLDRSHPVKYNKQQIVRIKQLAIQLKVDTEENIMSDKSDPHKLMELIEIARIKK